MSVQVIEWDRINGFSQETIERVKDAILDLDYDIYIENDGIGPYEYWGFKGYDAGHNYAVLESTDYLVFEIKNGLSHPHTAAHELIYSVDEVLPYPWTVSKSFYKKHARHEEDMEEFKVRIKLGHEWSIKDGRLQVKFWLDQD